MSVKLLYAGPLTSSSSVVIDAPVAAVWATVADIRSWPTWYRDFEIKELTEVAPGGTLRWKLRGAPIRSRFAVVAPERELTWHGRMFGYQAVDRHVLEPTDGGRTTVTLSESLTGPLVTLLYSETRLRASHEAWLTALKTFVEGN